MYNLLSAGFMRLKKNKIFLGMMFLSFGIAILVLFKGYSSNKEIILDKLTNEFTLCIGLFIAIFVSMFVGKEHSEGIIRNKIIVRT